MKDKEVFVGILSVLFFLKQKCVKSMTLARTVGRKGWLIEIPVVFLTPQLFEFLCSLTLEDKLFNFEPSSQIATNNRDIFDFVVFPFALMLFRHNSLQPISFDSALESLSDGVEEIHQSSSVEYLPEMSEKAQSISLKEMLLVLCEFDYQVSANMNFGVFQTCIRISQKCCEVSLRRGHSTLLENKDGISFHLDFVTALSLFNQNRVCVFTVEEEASLSDELNRLFATCLGREAVVKMFIKTAALSSIKHLPSIIPHMFESMDMETRDQIGTNLFFLLMDLPYAFPFFRMENSQSIENAVIQIYTFLFGNTFSKENLLFSVLVTLQVNKNLADTLNNWPFIKAVFYNRSSAYLKDSVVLDVNCIENIHERNSVLRIISSYNLQGLDFNTQQFTLSTTKFINPKSLHLYQSCLPSIKFFFDFAVLFVSSFFACSETSTASGFTSDLEWLCIPQSLFLIIPGTPGCVSPIDYLDLIDAFPESIKSTEVEYFVHINPGKHFLIFLSF